MKEILNQPNEGGVLVIDAQENLHTAMVGDMIAGAGVDNGWAGIIVNGAIRDSQEIGTMDIGVKALGTNPRKSAKDKVGKVDITVQFGGIEFVPGQYVYADADGIVVSETPVEAKES